MTDRYNADIHHRRSIRLKGYDYSQAGAYFVTVCTQNRECLFGEIADFEMRLNEYGRVVNETWEWLRQQYSRVDLDEWIVMPNHLHGIILMTDKNDLNDSGRGGSRTAPTSRDSGIVPAPTKRKPLGRLIGAFKTVSTKRINEIRATAGAQVWQRNYYEHIIRDEKELNRIREYIAANPALWANDENNPARTGSNIGLQ